MIFYMAFPSAWDTAVPLLLKSPLGLSSNFILFEDISDFSPYKLSIQFLTYCTFAYFTISLLSNIFWAASNRKSWFNWFKQYEKLITLYTKKFLSKMVPEFIIAADHWFCHDLVSLYLSTLSSSMCWLVLSPVYIMATRRLSQLASQPYMTPCNKIKG